MWPDRDPSSTAAIISSDVSGREGEAKDGGRRPRERRTAEISQGHAPARSLAGTTSQDAMRPPDDPDGRHLYSPAGNPRCYLHVLTAYSVGTRPGEGGPSHSIPCRELRQAPGLGYLRTEMPASQPMAKAGVRRDIFGREANSGVGCARRA